jgi:hypothetical protein
MPLGEPAVDQPLIALPAALAPLGVTFQVLIGQLLESPAPLDFGLPFSQLRLVLLAGRRSKSPVSHSHKGKMGSAHFILAFADDVKVTQQHLQA